MERRLNDALYQSNFPMSRVAVCQVGCTILMQQIIAAVSPEVNLFTIAIYLSIFMLRRYGNKWCWFIREVNIALTQISVNTLKTVNLQIFVINGCLEDYTFLSKGSAIIH